MGEGGASLKAMHRSPKFRTKHIFTLIPQALRCDWLQQKIIEAMSRRITSIERFREYRNKRAAFSVMGPGLQEDQLCFVCNQSATVRHHITPLILGGNNKFNNIVPLCHDCHVHVHSVGPREPTVREDGLGATRIKELLRDMYPA